MFRKIIPRVVLVPVLLTFCGSAHAQWGYGYYPYGYGGYGWGGWGGTLQGDIARGLGYFNVGAGIYNEQTAIARAINTDTAIRWNQYVYLSQREATHQYMLRRNAALAKDKSAYEAIVQRIRDNPTSADIDNGDALNAALDQLSDPRLHTSALRMAETPISAKTIRDIPFRNAAEAVAFSLAQLKADSEWPAALLEPRFASERSEFEQRVDEIRHEVLDKAHISHSSVSNLREVLTRLKEKLALKPLEDKAEKQEAMKFIKTVTALTRMFEKPNIAEVLAELDKMQTTTVGNLLAFMHTFNLRFGPASTPRERQVYAELYPVLDQTRDRILAEVKLDEQITDRAKKAKLADFFSAMELEQIEGKKKAPPSPKPGQP